MAWYPYSYKTAFDPISGEKAPAGSVGEVYAVGDTAFTTPLETFDLSGLPVSLEVQGEVGYVPSFQVEDNASVIWKSGDYIFEMVTSMPLPGPQGSNVVGAVDNGDGTVTFSLSNGESVGPVGLPDGPEGPRGPAGYNATGAVEDQQTLADYVNETAGTNPFSEALEAKFIGGGLADRVDTLETSTPTLEETGYSVILDRAAISAAGKVPVFSALFPCRLEQVALSCSAPVAASDIDYWTVELCRYRDGTRAVIGAKTTKTVASGGEGIALFTGWHYDLITFTADGFFKGDVFAVEFTPTGAPAPLEGPCLTFRAPAADVEPDGAGEPVLTLIAEDDFNRADGPLGTMTTGQAWEIPATNVGTTEIVTNGAEATIDGASQYLVDAGTPDAEVQITIAAMGAAGTHGVALRYVDADNHWGTNYTGLFRVGLGVQVSWATALTAGDTIKVKTVGDDFTVYIDYGTTGTFEQVATHTSADLNTATKCGFRNSGLGHRWDDFKVWA